MITLNKPNPGDPIESAHQRAHVVETEANRIIAGTGISAERTAGGTIISLSPNAGDVLSGRSLSLGGGGSVNLPVFITDIGFIPPTENEVGYLTVSKSNGTTLKFAPVLYLTLEGGLVPWET